MPELPEVETVRRQLAGSLAGARYSSVDQVEPAMLRDCTEQQLRVELPGRSIELVGRRGKYIVVTLGGEGFLTLHLGMTGQLLVDPKDAGAHTRFIFGLEAADGRPMRLEVGEEDNEDEDARNRTRPLASR